jgi:hypothetical protein
MSIKMLPNINELIPILINFPVSVHCLSKEASYSTGGCDGIFEEKETEQIQDYRIMQSKILTRECSPQVASAP